MTLVQLELPEALIKSRHLPELKDLFIPCPLCKGTTSIDYEGYSFCNSCGQKWSLFGQPKH